MAIREVFNNFSQAIGNYCDTTQQAFMSEVMTFKELRNDPDVFQKVGQIAFSSLQLILMNSSSSSLSRLSSLIVSAVGMHDFYRVIQYPRHWFFPINSKGINEDVVWQDLTNHLADQLQIDKASADFEELRNITKDCLVAQLTLMGDNDDAYRNLGEFKAQLEKRLQNNEQLKAIALDEEGEIKELAIDLSTLEVTSQWMRNTPLLEKITNIMWAVVDVLAAAWWLKEWNLLDTAKCAEAIGNYRAFRWVKNQDLEVCLIGSICIGEIWQLLESVRQLRDEALTHEERRNARWKMITSLAELTFFGSIFTNLTGRTHIHNGYIQLLAIGARSLGLLSIVTRPKHQFFPESTVFAR